jgi:hypothetical protein
MNTKVQITQWSFEELLMEHLKSSLYQKPRVQSKHVGLDMPPYVYERGTVRRYASGSFNLAEEWALETKLDKETK